jgi:glycosyltransferase involved in cell wall biosynthesis
MGSTTAHLGNDIEHKLDFADAVAEAFLEAGEQHLRRGDCESALRSAHVAASLFIRQNRRLTSPRLEHLLQLVASRLEAAAVVRAPTPIERLGKPMCLHVLDEALHAGGLTAMAARWINNDREHRTHCIAILDQRAPVPQHLADAVAASGGHIWLPPSGASFVSRALWLRALAADDVDLIVLHVGVSDTVFAAALGRSGGAPILHVNHTAHLFWSGVTVADLLSHCRGSAQEKLWASRHRGADAVTVPIPLLPLAEPAGAEAATDVSQIRRDFDLPPNAQVLLTIGATFKYQRTEQHDFVAAIEQVLCEAPQTYLLAIGVVADERWRKAAQRLGGRIRALGPVSQVVIADARAITDVYIEGFPFGTTTSLLETALHGIPVVLAPAESPPPYGSDGVALDEVLTRPTSVAAYQEEIKRLLNSSQVRTGLGEQLAVSVARHHVGSGWATYLAQAIDALPASHSVREPVEPVPTECEAYRHWAHFVDHTDTPYSESLEHAMVRAMLLGLRPRLSPTLRDACRRASHFRDGHGIPAAVMQLVLNRVLPLLPQPVATATFRALAFCCRSAVLTQVRNRLAALWRGRRAGTWYDDYRDIKR